MSAEARIRLKCALINPPYATPVIREGRCQSPQEMRQCSIPQLSLAYIAAGLEKEGHYVKAWDCIANNTDLSALVSELKEWRADIVVLNTTTPTLASDMRLVATLKEELDNIFIMAFGTHVSALPNDSLVDNKALDAVIVGEPERTVVEVLKRIAVRDNDFSAIAGLAWRSNGQIIYNGKPVFNEDLDTLGMPAWHYLPINRYKHPVFNKPFLMINTSRGCAQKCIFCVAHLYYGYQLRLRTVQSVLDEIEYDIDKFGIKHFWLYADDFTRRPIFVKELCRGILERHLKITWWTNSRVDCLDKEMYIMMAKAGCYLLSLGGESGSDRMLGSMRKGIESKQIMETAKMLQSVGINSLVYFLIGLPGETRETIEETIRFAIRANPDYVEFYPAIPYPGTDFYNIALKEGIISVNDYSLYLCGGKNFVLKVDNLAKEELDWILRKAYQRFYFRPKYLLKLLRKVITPSELIRLMLFGMSYFKRFRKEN